MFGILITFALSSRDTLSQLPFTAQRVLSVFPWVEATSSIKNETKASSDWRFEIWKWALDSRTGIVKNYIWGDGLVANSALHQRISRGTSRKEIQPTQQDIAVQIRNWHGGFIAVLQEMGIVGLCIVTIGIVYAMMMSIKIGIALRNSDYFKYYCVYTAALMYSPFTFYILPATTATFFATIAGFAFLKVFHTIAVEEGLIKLDRNNRKYIPLLIQQEVA